jgi:hypothetical protein
LWWRRTGRKITGITSASLASCRSDALARRGRWVLIFDNARGPDDIKDYLPAGNSGHVLVTSRNAAFRGIAHSLPVSAMNTGEAVEFLLERAPDTDKEGAEALAEALGGLPLALEHAGAYTRGGTLRDWARCMGLGRAREVRGVGRESRSPSAALRAGSPLRSLSLALVRMTGGSGGAFMSGKIPTSRKGREKWGTPQGLS